MNDLISLEKIAQWQKLKTLVLDSVSSPITKRVYNMALDEFMGWFQQAPRPGFTKATVSAWRVSLEDRRLGSSSIIVRMSAIRKLAAENCSFFAFRSINQEHKLIISEALFEHSQARIKANPPVTAEPPNVSL